MFAMRSKSLPLISKVCYEVDLEDKNNVAEINYLCIRINIINVAHKWSLLVYYVISYLLNNILIKHEKGVVRFIWGNS